MQEVGRAVIESSDGDFIAHLFFVRGCSNRHILGMCRKRSMRLSLKTGVCLLV